MTKRQEREYYVLVNLFSELERDRVIMVAVTRVLQRTAKSYPIRIGKLIHTTSSAER
jgi:hypothetical protein